MGFTIQDVEFLIATQWLQLSIAGVAIFYGLAESYREWLASRKTRVTMYGRKAAADRMVNGIRMAAAIRRAA